jgi:hypothetical protein
VSSYATAYLDDGRPLRSFRNGVDELFLMLFTEADWIVLEGEDAQTLIPDLPEEDQRVVGFRVAAAVLRDRLDVMGVPLSTVVAEFDELVRENIQLIQRYRTPNETLATEDDAEVAYLEALTWEQWLAQLHHALGRGDAVRVSGRREPMGTASRLMSLWDEFEERYPLRAIVEVLPDNAHVTLDLTDLIEGGWLEPSTDPQSVGRQRVLDNSSSLLPAVVLVEGKFDAEVLSAALRVRRPHLER